MCCPETDQPAVPRIGMVADDLTGACDSGVEFLACCESVMVVVEAECPAAQEDEDAMVVWNTQSRSLSPEEAYRRTVNATRCALLAGADLILKKVDSALRGNFGIEIGAVMDASGAEVAFILPAIPEAGRETIGGVQHVEGVPVAKSFYSRDPEHPVLESNVLARAEDGSNRRAALISLQDVRGGRAAEAATRLKDGGYQLIVVDAQSSNDLNCAVKSLMRVGEAKVFVGCQGLAEALAAQMPPIRQLPTSLGAPHGPTLLMCGTLHPRSRCQLDFAASRGNLRLLDIQVSRAAEGRTRDVYSGEVVENCQESFTSGQNVAVRLCGEATKLPAESRGLVLGFLSNLARQLVERAHPAALVLTGGETAYAVCRVLNIRVLKLHARIAPLVVASRAVGGAFHDMVVVTKGGSVGPDDLLLRIHASLHARKS